MGPSLERPQPSVHGGACTPTPSLAACLLDSNATTIRRSGSTSPGVGLRHKTLLQRSREEVLSQVASLFGVMAAPSDVGVKRIPIGAAKLGQRLSGERRIAITRLEHQTPASRGEVTGR